MSIYTQMHDKYGAPSHVAEFRLFMLNDCFKSCENCFYNRSGNSLSNYEEIAFFAKELKQKGYQLETCYLLPTDFFENQLNLDLLSTEKVKSIVNQFSYLGVASTMEGDLDFSAFKNIVDTLEIEEVELQINLVNEKMFLESYFNELESNIAKIRDLFSDKIVFNLALNLGRNISDDEFQRIKYFVHELSDDGILEINFTFLYNDRLSFELKSQRLKHSLQAMNKLGEMYNNTESRYNERTLLRKPAFIFKDDQTYVAPIIPFDEYAFVKDEKFCLSEMNFDSFVETHSRLEEDNTPILDKCESCDNLNVCMGKGYFITASSYNLPCFLDA